MNIKVQTSHIKAFVTSVLLFCSVTIKADNPLVKHIYTADPTARVYNGKLFIYPSHDVPWDTAWVKLGVERESNGHVMTDYHCFSTTDFMNITDHGVIVAQNDVPWGLKNGYGMWAPCITFKEGTYYYYFPNNLLIKVTFVRLGWLRHLNPRVLLKLNLII